MTMTAERRVAGGGEGDRRCSNADLLRRLGDISPERVRLWSMSGCATVGDVATIQGREKRLFELVNGVLVEKCMGWRESVLVMAIGEALRGWVVPRKLGAVSGESGMMRLFGNDVRIPDVAFVSRARLGDGGEGAADVPVPPLVPDLVVEVLSESNTKAEMARKRQEYFEAGVRLLWEVDPKNKSVAVYTGVEQMEVVGEHGVLNGGEVLPGFTLSLKAIFDEVDGLFKPPSKKS